MKRPTSLLMGGDRHALPLLVRLHAVAAPRILDCTYGGGDMWRGCALRPTTTMDVDEARPTDYHADFAAMPFADGTYDVLVFDPPHLPNAAASPKSATSDVGIFQRRYGLHVTDDRRAGEHIGGLFAPFLAEAKRVLVEDGIVLAKLVDFVHNHRYQWQHVAFLHAAWAAGMTACDCLIKADAVGVNLKSGQWDTVYHLRRAHTYWLVVRNGPRCEGPGHGDDRTASEQLPLFA